MQPSGAREVYALCKQEEYLQALQLAEQLVNSPAADLGAFKAHIHALFKAMCHDKEHCRRYLQPYVVKFLHEGINRLYGGDYLEAFKNHDSTTNSRKPFVDGFDGYIASALSQLLISLDRPNAEELLEAGRLSREKKYQQAYQLYTKAASKGPLTKYEENSYAWTLERLCTDAKEWQKYRYVVEYLNLKQVEKPSLVNSLMLRHADELFEYRELDFPAYLEAFDLATLQPEDHAAARFTNNDGKEVVCASLYDRVMHHALKNAFSRLTQRLPLYLPAVDVLLKRAGEINTSSVKNAGDLGFRQWILYDEVKLLCALGRGQEALAFARRFVKEKYSEDYPWSLLCEVYLQNGDAKNAAVCICRSLVNKDDKLQALSVKQCVRAAEIFHRAADASHAQELADLASFLVNNSGMGEDALKLFRENNTWYSPVIKEHFSDFDTLKEELIELAGKADLILYADLKVYHACAGSQIDLKSKTGKVRKMRDVFISLGPGTVPLQTISRAKLLNPFKKWTQVDVRLLPDPPKEDSKIRVVTVEKGSLPVEEVMPFKTAAVTYVNRERRCYTIIFEDKTRSVLFMDKVKGQLKTGDCVQVQLAKRWHKGRMTMLFLNSRRTDQRPEALFKEEITTVKNVHHAGFAHTADSIFIPEALVMEHALINGDKVKVKAVLTWNKKREQYNWSAYFIELLSGKKAKQSTGKSPASGKAAEDDEPPF